MSYDVIHLSRSLHGRPVAMVDNPNQGTRTYVAVDALELLLDEVEDAVDHRYDGHDTCQVTEAFKYAVVNRVYQLAAAKSEEREQDA